MPLFFQSILLETGWRYSRRKITTLMTYDLLRRWIQFNAIGQTHWNSFLSLQQSIHKYCDINSFRSTWRLTTCNGYLNAFSTRHCFNSFHSLNSLNHLHIQQLTFSFCKMNLYFFLTCSFISSYCSKQQNYSTTFSLLFLDRVKIRFARVQSNFGEVLKQMAFSALWIYFTLTCSHCFNLFSTSA